MGDRAIIAGSRLSSQKTVELMKMREVASNQIAELEPRLLKLKATPKPHVTFAATEVCT